MIKRCTALVLAGQRAGGDPLALSAMVPHKAALPVAGRPMAEWVVDALRDSPAIDRVLVAADWRTLGPAVPLLARDKVVPVAAFPTLAETVLAVLAAVPPPILVTTADHPLLTPSLLLEFLSGVPDHADAAVAVARAETVRAAYPHTRRTWFRFRGARVTGCNLYLLATPRAERAVRFWQRLDRHRKEPAALVGMLGTTALILWLLGFLSLDGAARRLSRKVGARLSVVTMASAEAAIDVDKPEDLQLAETILAGRGGPYSAAG